MVANGKIANILEMANHIAKRGEIWDSGVQVEHIWGTFDLSLQGHSGIIIGDLPIFPKIQISKSCFFYIYDSFSSKLSL